MAIVNKQIGLSVENQKEITSILLDNLLNDKTDQDKILKCKFTFFIIHYKTNLFLIVVNNKASELTALGNVLLKSSKCKLI